MSDQVDAWGFPADDRLATIERRVIAEWWATRHLCPNCGRGCLMTERGWHCPDCDPPLPKPRWGKVSW